MRQREAKSVEREGGCRGVRDAGAAGALRLDGSEERMRRRGRGTHQQQRRRTRASRAQELRGGAHRRRAQSAEGLAAGHVAARARPPHRRVPRGGRSGGTWIAEVMLVVSASGVR